MTPGARVQAAIEVLDTILSGTAAEKALTGWARRSRFAGSKDRAAVRDHVFDVLRRMRSCAAMGGGMTGRGLMLGLLRQDGIAPETLFTGDTYAPPPLDEADRAGHVPAGDGAMWDLPDWILPLWRESLGSDDAAVAEALRHRAPVFLRANRLKGARDTARARLAQEGIETRPHALAPTALEVTANARRVAASAAYRDGLVELQDAASQAVIDALEPGATTSILDYCAGGGGKTLALAAATGGRIAAHDAAPRRMKDLPDRAARAGARVEILETVPDGARYDLVLCDAPCSGSGAWRRSPEGKWRLDQTGLTELLAVQAEILDRAAGLVALGGRLAYATCSVLRPENDGQADAFLARHPAFAEEARHRWTPLDGADGFFLAVFRRSG